MDSTKRTLSFDTLKELSKSFSRSEVNFEGIGDIEIEDVKFTLDPTHDTYTFFDAVIKGKIPQIKFTSELIDVVFLWHSDKGSIVPFKMILLNKLDSEKFKASKMSIDTNEEDEEQQTDDSRPSTSDSTDVTEISFHAPFYGVTATGKIDTGADMSSIHATDIKVDVKTNYVSFVSDVLSDQVITMQYEERKPISSADAGVEYRPVIKLDVTVNGKKMSGMLFNLNDRADMSYKILIGQNILEKGNFLVDPANNSLINRD